MIFVDEYNGLRETHYSTPGDILGGEFNIKFYLEFINSRFRDPDFDLYHKECLFGKEGTHELYDSKNEVQV